MPGAIDTPDFQHGVISAQKLLGVIPAEQTTLTVDVPINAESIVAMIQGQASQEGCKCVGVTSGMQYPSGAIVMAPGADNTISVWFDVSAAVDEQVTITLFTAATGSTYIYGDSAVHTTNDPVTVDVLHGAMDAGNNAMYTIPRPPGSGAGDHPPVELQTAFIEGAGYDTTVLQNASAGQRYRIFYAVLVGGAGEYVAWLTNAPGGANFMLGWSTPVATSFYPSGLPLLEATGVVVSGQNAPFAVSLVFTVENV